MTFNTRTAYTEKQSDWLYGYGVLLTNVQCHRYLYPYHDIENTGTYNWKHTWNHADDELTTIGKFHPTLNKIKHIYIVFIINHGGYLATKE